MMLTFLGGGVLMLAPEGETKKGIRLLCSLLAVGCILFPLVPLLSESEMDINDIVDKFKYDADSEQTYDEIYNLSLTDAELKNAEYELKSQVISRFNVKNKDFNIKLNCEIKSGEYCISSATLILLPTGIHIDPRPICIYISEQLSCPCEVYYDT